MEYSELFLKALNMWEKTILRDAPVGSYYVPVFYREDDFTLGVNLMDVKDIERLARGETLTESEDD